MAGDGSVDAMRERIADILRENPFIPGIESFTCKPNEVTVEEDPILSEGFVNFLVRVRAGDGSTVVAKYSPPYVKAYGEGALLSQERAELEMTALQLFYQHSPGSGPKTLAPLMEDLVGYNMLHSELFAGNVNKVAIGKLAEHMARIHRSTHKDNISAQEWGELQELNKHLPMIEEMTATFTSHPYIQEPTDEVAKQLKDLADRRFFGNSKLTTFFDQIISDYVHCQECLIHGDPHTRDILVKGDDAKFIDPEFAHLGQCRVDVGMYLAHLVMAYYYHLLTPEDNDGHRKIAYKIQDCCQHMVNTYLEHMSWRTGDRKDHVTQLLRDVAAFAGMELFRSVCSGEQKKLGSSQIEMVESGIRLLEQYHVVDSVDKMIYIALGLR